MTLSKKYDEDGIDKVIHNHEGQYSIWPIDRPNPPGWTDTGKSGLKQECITYIKSLWNKRPMSLYKHMEKRKKQLLGKETDNPQQRNFVPYLETQLGTRHKKGDINTRPNPGGESSKMALAEDARIILIKIGGIGDYVLMMPAVRALRERYPHAQIDCIVGNEKAKKFLEVFGLLNTIIALETEHELVSFTQGLAQAVNLGHRLKAKPYDAVLCFNHLLPNDVPFLSALMIITGAKYRIGLDCGTTGSLLHVGVPDAGYGAKHEVEYRIAVVEAIDAIVHDRRLFIPINNEFKQQARAIITDEGTQTWRRPLIGIHPGCHNGYPARRWMPERFARLADQLYQEFGGQLLLLGGPEEVDVRERVQSTMHSQMPCRNLSGAEELLLTTALIEQCDLFVGNDSGLMHIAAAVNTPTIGIFGLTNPQAWTPFMPADPTRGRAVYRQLPCMPCNYVGLHSGDTLGCATRDCLTQIQVETVADVARSLLSATFRSPEDFLSHEMEKTSRRSDTNSI
jgi:lipopolysaccharide heptosyltransferase II